jgi:hypothetical protein
MPTIKGGITFGKNMSDEDKAKYTKALGRDKKRNGLDLAKMFVKGEVYEGKEARAKQKELVSKQKKPVKKKTVKKKSKK